MSKKRAGSLLAAAFGCLGLLLCLAGCQDSGAKSLASEYLSALQSGQVSEAALLSASLQADQDIVYKVEHAREESRLEELEDEAITKAMSALSSSLLEASVRSFEITGTTLDDSSAVVTASVSGIDPVSFTMAQFYESAGDLADSAMKDWLANVRGITNRQMLEEEGAVTYLEALADYANSLESQDYIWTLTMEKTEDGWILKDLQTAEKS